MKPFTLELSSIPNPIFNLENGWDDNKKMLEVIIVSWL